MSQLVGFRIFGGIERRIVFSVLLMISIFDESKFIYKAQLINLAKGITKPKIIGVQQNIQMSDKKRKFDQGVFRII